MTGVSIARADQGALGFWLTQKEGAVIEFFECGGDGEVCGRIAWLKKPYHDNGELKRDDHNRDPAMRDRPQCGLTVVTGLKGTGKGVWKHGKVYDPQSGKSYGAKLKLEEPGRLKIRVFLGVPIVGITERWSRPQGIEIGCVPA